MKAKNLVLLFFIFIAYSLAAQVVSYSPLYPTVNDTVTIIYNAAQGNGTLSGIGPVYAHTGVLTNESVNQTDWLHKPSEWGEPDSIVLMEDLGNNLHKIEFQIADYFEVGSTEIVNEICFVFRNADGSIAGKNADGSDIYIHVYEENVFARFTGPISFPLKPLNGQTVSLEVSSTKTAMINLYHDGTLVSQAFDTILNHNIIASTTGKHWIWFEASANGETIIDSMFYIVQAAPVIEDLPTGTVDGVNYINDSTVVLCLFAPYKDFVYLLGDFNNWEIEPDWQMKRTSDGDRYWLELSGLTPHTEYRYQYFVDFEVNIADPYADKFLDRWNDNIIHPVIYPDLIDYPEGKTTEMVSVFQPGQGEYVWQVTDFQKPDNRDMVIYEVLLRDFHMWHSFKILKDSLEYFKKLGVNTIELMPVNEFDGNNSWGYMPAFYFAPDKYYGTKDGLKEFVDAAHANGIAVIIDIVLNHASGQNSQARLYKDKESGHTTDENPWFNRCIPHPFGYHHDFDHSAAETQTLVDRILDHWMTEFNIDGFRFDLSKGFTNNISVTYDNWEDCNIVWDDVGAWGNYDANRVGYLQRMANVVWANHPGTFLILEHLAQFDEEVVLSNHGFMLWCGATTNQQYKQAAIGFSSNWDFKYGVSYQHYQGNNLGRHNLVGYMESHDEERLMWECMKYGNEFYESGDTVPLYSIKDQNTALERMALVAGFFFTVPGPKMMWMFGERGYDYSINWPAVDDPGVTRTDPKPPRWDYMEKPNRQKLFKTYAALIDLKTSNKLFRTSNYEMSTANADKRIRLWDDGSTGSSMQAVVLGNFDVVEQSVWPEFSTAGMWFDYLTGDTIVVENTQLAGSGFTFQYAPGEWHIYTDSALAVPDLSIDTLESLPEIALVSEKISRVYPNPFNTKINIEYLNKSSGNVTIKIYDLVGREVKSFGTEKKTAGIHSRVWNGTDNTGRRLQKGYYLYSITTNEKTESGKIMYLP